MMVVYPPSRKTTNGNCRMKAKEVSLRRDSAPDETQGRKIPIVRLRELYVFGNEDVVGDKLAFEVAEKLAEDFPEIKFQKVNPNEDLPFVDQEQVLILDVVWGLERVEVITEKELERLNMPDRVTAHDYDLGFQLKYLTKLGRLKEVRIIGLPMGKPIDYDSIQSTLRKLVAQDIHGS